MAMVRDADAGFLREVENEPPVIVVAHDLRPDLASRALAHGAAGSVSIDADAAVRCSPSRRGWGGRPH
jgi:hypothetical protein